MNMKVVRAAATGLVLAGLVLAPREMLDVVRWVAVAAIIAGAAWHYLLRDASRPQANPTGQPVNYGSSAVLVVSITDSAGRTIETAERQLFKNAIMQCVRASDRVADIDGRLYSIHLLNVAPDLAEGIGNRICEQLQDLIVFDNAGAIKQIGVSVGGVTSFSGPLPDGQRIARENLAKLEKMRGVNVLMSRAA